MDPNDETIVAVDDSARTSKNPTVVFTFDPTHLAPVDPSALSLLTPTSPSRLPFLQKLGISPSPSLRSMRSSDSYGMYFYERIPEFHMFQLFCDENFPGVAQMAPLMVMDDDTLTPSPGLTILTEMSENSDCPGSPVSVLGELPSIERRNRSFYVKRAAARKVRFDGPLMVRDNTPSASSRAQRADAEANWPSTKTARHLGSLLVLTEEYLHLRTDWEVCREVFELARHDKKGLMSYSTTYETLRQMGAHYKRTNSKVSRRPDGVGLEQFFLMYLEATGQLHLVTKDDVLCRAAFWDLQRSTKQLTVEEAELICVRLERDNLIHSFGDRENFLQRLNYRRDGLVMFEDVFRLLIQKKKTLRDYEHLSEVQRRVRRICSMTFSDMDLAASCGFKLLHGACCPCGTQFCGSLKNFCSKCFYDCCGVM